MVREDGSVELRLLVRWQSESCAETNTLLFEVLLNS
jgi:hypothetical protein